LEAMKEVAFEIVILPFPLIMPSSTLIRENSSFEIE